MASETPPFALQAGSYGAEQTRRAIYAMLARGATIGSVAGGLIGSTDLALTAGSGMQVLCAPGEVIVPGSTSATQSGYYGRVSSSTALSIAASDPTNPRVDRIVALVKDAAYSGSENLFTPAVVTGTPTAGATLGNKETHGWPAAPASSFTIGAVLVPAKAVSIITGDIENLATLAAGLLVPVARLSGLLPGTQLGSGTVRQETGTAQSFVSWGHISAEGAIEDGSGDFTVSKIATGEYEIVWKTPRKNNKYAILGGIQLDEAGELPGYDVTPRGTHTTTEHFIMQVYIVGTGAANQAFSFISAAHF